MPYIYMMRCVDQSLYTGITTDVERRMQEHCGLKGSGAKYTRSRRPMSLEMVWETDSWSHAAKLEYRIKQLSRRQKEALLLHPEGAGELMFRYAEEAVYTPRPEWKTKLPVAAGEQGGAGEYGEIRATAGISAGD